MTTTTEGCAKCGRPFEAHFWCAQCGRAMSQPADPGSYREYCSNGCRQRAYRARGGRASGTRYESASARRRREEQEAWDREQARREEERQRSYRRRHGAPPPPPSGMPGWCTSHPAGESPLQRKMRRKAYLLMNKGMSKGVTPEEAASFCGGAERLRVKYGL